MDNLIAARSQMGMSLAFHIVFAVIGVSLPLMMTIAEWRWRSTGDPAYLFLAKRWAKGTTILFAVGAISGTVLQVVVYLTGRGLPDIHEGSTGQMVGSNFIHRRPICASWPPGPESNASAPGRVAPAPLAGNRRLELVELLLRTAAAEV
jgi:hypothetical protein